MIIYELTKWRKDNYTLGEEPVAFYASWKDANLRKRYCEMNDNDVYDYCIYTRNVIPDFRRNQMNTRYDKASEQIQQDHTDGLISGSEYFQQMRDLDAEYQEYVEQEVNSYRDSFF